MVDEKRASLLLRIVNHNKKVEENLPDTSKHASLLFKSVSHAI